MKIIQFCIAYLLCNQIYSQNSNGLQGKAIYTFSHIRDTTSRDKVKTENMILFFENQKSLYQSYQKFIDDSLINLPRQNNEIEQGLNRTIKIKGSISEVIITDFLQHNQFVIQPWVDDTLMVKNNLENIGCAFSRERSQASTPGD